MKKSLAFLFVLIVLAPPCLAAGAPFSEAAVSENSWTALASMYMSRTGAGAAAVNGIVYVIGGSQRYNTSGGFSYMSINSTEAYDPATDTWVEKKPMPTPRDSLGAAAFQGKIYCFGGRNVSKDYSISINATEVYDTETDSWETRNPMPTARSGLDASEVGGKIYLIGGLTESESSSIAERSAQVEIYDPVADSWSTGSRMPTAVSGYASAIVDGKIYIISGVASGSTKTNLTQIYDPETDKWSMGVPIPMSVSYAAAGAVTGANAAKAIYVIGGSNVTYPLSGQFANQVYFLETDSWAMAAPMPVDRAGLALAVVNDTIYVMGGGHNIFTQDSTVAMQYTPLTSPIVEMEPFPTVWAAIIAVVVIALVAVGALIYSRKRDRPV